MTVDPAPGALPSPEDKNNGGGRPLSRREKRKALRARDPSALRPYRDWKDYWRWGRYGISVGVMIIWILLLILVGCRIVALIFEPSMLKDRAVGLGLAGIFIAWLTLTSAIHRALKPHRPENGPQEYQGLLDRFADHVEKWIEAYRSNAP